MIEAIVAAALHAIVLSVILGAALFGLVFILVRTLALRATARHALWTIALVTTAMMPLAGLGVSAARAIAAPVDSWSAASTSAASHGVAVKPRTHAAAAQKQAQPPAKDFSFSMPAWQPHLTRLAAVAIVGVWIVGAFVGLVGLVASLIRVRGLKKRSSPLEGDLADDLPWLTENHARDREIYLRLSFETETPVAIGFRRPVILIPTELATHGGLAAIDQLIRHEHAHLRRYDDWTNLAQRLIERIFWFNPIVWLVGARIALEREIASDDAVVEETGHAQEYAKSLWRLAREMRMPEHAIVAPGAMLTRKQITVRIESLLDSRPAIPSLTPIAGFGVVAAAVACIIAVGSSAPAIELPQQAAPSAMASAAPAVVAKPSVPKTATLSTAATHPLPRATAQVIVKEKEVKVFVHDHDRGTRVAQVTATATSEPQTLVPSARRGTVLPREAREAIAKLPGAISGEVSRAVSQGMRDTADALSNIDDESGLGNRNVPANADVSTLTKILAHCMGCDLSGRNLRGADLRNLALTGVNLSGTDLRDAKLDGARFTGVNLNGARLDGASLVNAHFVGTDINGISLRGANTAGLTMTGVSLASFDFRNLQVRDLLSHCVGCNLAGANLSNLDLHGIKIAGANFQDANLRGVNLSGAQLDGSCFQNANLHGANLRNASFSGASFDGADLSGADTTGAIFTGVDLRGMHLQ
jgi:uncharacterized protein YjbI with pentapeptide repeats/beta-lactamase regulating signal transducer with metallopeptidase domain